jgi:hypothetical protein
MESVQNCDDTGGSWPNQVVQFDLANAMTE